MVNFRCIGASQALAWYNIAMDKMTPFLADGLVFVILAIAVFVFIFKIPNNKKYLIYGRMLVAGLTSYLVAKIMSVAYQPSSQRPFELMNVDPGTSYLDNPGFPSDHALFVWVLVFAVFYATRNRWLALIMAILAILVCIGRVVALVHAPIDVIGGTIAAMVGTMWYVDEHTCKKDKTHV